MAGVTDTGFDAETTDTLRAAIEDEVKLALGSAFNVRPTSVAGVFIGVMAKKLSDLWEAAEAIYGSQYPETAFGTSLDQLGLLTGAQRLEATRSEVTLGVTGTPGTIITTGARVLNSDTGTYWRLKTDNGNITIPGTSATTGTWESEDLGEILGAAGSLDTIDTVISGWDAVDNAEDAEPGNDEETDAEFRLRRAELLVSQGAGTVDAIRSDILAIEGVLQVQVYENVSLITDGNGLPGKAFEAVVRQGSAASADIWQAIWDTKPAGISSYGTTVGTAVDAVGSDHLVAYSEATEVDMYVALTAVTTGASFQGLTATLVSDIKAAVVAYEEDLGVGDDVIRAELIGQVMDVEDVYDLSTLYVDRYASPTASSNTTIGLREVATFDTSRVSVTLV